MYMVDTERYWWRVARALEPELHKLGIPSRAVAERMLAAMSNGASAEDVIYKYLARPLGWLGYHKTHRRVRMLWALIKWTAKFVGVCWVLLAWGRFLRHGW